MREGTHSGPLTPEERMAYFTVPPVVYKFLGPLRGPRTLQDMKIKCTPPSEFDDVFDSVHVEELLVEELNVPGQNFYFELSHPSGMPIGDRDAWRAWLQKSVDLYPGFGVDAVILCPPVPNHAALMDFRNSFLSALEHLEGVQTVLSLTDQPLNKLMWDRYGNGHRGFAVGFDTHSPMFQVGGYPALRKVIYSAEPPRGPREVISWRRWLVKSHVYEYESEWRGRYPSKVLEEAVGDEGQSIFLKSIPPGAIKSVLLGCRIDSNTEEQVMAAGEPGVEVWRCVMGEGTYELKLERVV